MTLMCTKHYEAIVLHDTLQYHDTDMYQTLWIHCSTYTLKYHDTDMSQTVWKYSSTWHHSNRYIQNIMKLLFNMTPPNIMMLMCTKHYGALVLQCYLPMFWRRWCTPNIIYAMFYMTPSNTDIYQTLWI